MTAPDQQRISDLQQQLDAARRAVEETRTGMNAMIDRVATEARLYRSLFWSILTVAAATALFYLLQQ